LRRVGQQTLGPPRGTHVKRAVAYSVEP